jgi:hypothetical protein
MYRKLNNEKKAIKPRHPQKIGWVGIHIRAMGYLREDQTKDRKSVHKASVLLQL